jgi:peroxiredoxin
MALQAGTPAPDFTLKNQHGEAITLSALRGQPVVVVFFPFAFSGICTGELCEIRDRFLELEQAAGTGVKLLAVSVDHLFANRAFADHDGYSFDILSDFWPHGEVARAFGVFNDRAGAANRGTFVIDSQGIVQWSIEHPIGSARDFDAYRQALSVLA